jgi:hypothetical protein
MIDPAWQTPFIRRGRRPLLSGYDLPGDYDGDRWIPTPKWSGSAVEANVETLARIRRLIDAADLVKRAWLEKHWHELDRRYARLAHVRERAIARARAIIARGRVPQRPTRLRDARAAEAKALRRLVARAGISE